MLENDLYRNFMPFRLLVCLEWSQHFGKGSIQIKNKKCGFNAHFLQKQKQNAGCDVNIFDTQTIYFSQRHISTGQNASYNNAIYVLNWNFSGLKC